MTTTTTDPSRGTAPAPAAPPVQAPSTEAPWFRSAIIKTLEGTLLGIVTSTLLVAASFAFFPSLLDADYDLGLAFERWGREYLTPASQGLVPQTPTDSYVFVDVDPQPWVGGEAAPQAAASADACAALAKAALVPGGPTLNCQQARPVNRYVLAELIKAARARGAGLIVLDVDFSVDEGVVPAEESAYLRHAITAGEEGRAKVVLVRNAEYLGKHGQSQVDRVLLVPSKGFDASSFSTQRAVAGVALPSPGESVRRYPRCYRTGNHGEGRVPSLPYVAKTLIERPDAPIEPLCAEDGKNTEANDAAEDAAPRIRYSLPSMRAHEDDTLKEDDFRTWSIYRRIYSRCLAANFWNAESPCSRADYLAGKTVVIGASNRVRKDRHFTPLGEMAGAEVVINAIRSFLLFPHEHDKPFGLATKKKVLLILTCVPIWLAFYSVREYLRRDKDRKRSIWARIGREIILIAAFWLALWAVVVVSISTAFASFSMLVAVLAIAIEQYVEVVTTWVIHPFKRVLQYLLRMPPEKEAH